MVAFITFFIAIFISTIIICAIDSHKEEVTYARLKNRPSNVKMKYSDSKLAEFKKGDKGYVYDTKEVIKYNNGCPNKYFNVVLENGKKLLVLLTYIEWVSYIDSTETIPTETIPTMEESKKLE